VHAAEAEAAEIATDAVAADDKTAEDVTFPETSDGGASRNLERVKSKQLKAELEEMHSCLKFSDAHAPAETKVKLRA